ncbi:MAG: vitamin K epoxide reductase family protein [Dehalococcoidia bacterium]
MTLPARRPALLGTIAVLSLAGLAVTTYLSIVYLADSAPACGLSSGCETVANSRFARLFGIPVPIPGALMYAALLMGSLALAGFERRDLRVERAMLLLSVIGVAFSAYLTAASVFVLHATCQWCLASAALVTVILPLTVLVAFLRDVPASSPEDRRATSCALPPAV